MRYRAFISYSHADAQWAGWLHRRLEGYRIPRRLQGTRGEHGLLPDRLSPIFRDREDLASAGELGPRIEAALADSESLVVVCSPASARSPWVDKEIRHFARLGRADRIYCLIVDGEPHAGDARECFPPALRGGTGDGDGDAADAMEPLAADVRPGKDGKSLARLKLLAGLLGVELDRLRQREVARRQRHLLLVAAIALVIAITTTALAVQATVARDAAQRRQKQAEALVGFMLGNLNDKLQKVARLDILETVNDHAMAYFETLPADDLTDESLVQRAQALVNIGSVRLDQGQLPDALQSYRAAETIAARLAAVARDDIDRQLAHAEILAFIGVTHWYQGELAQAQARFEAAQRVLRDSRAIAPAEPRLLFQLSTLDNNVGHVLERRGRLAEARRHYREMLAIARELAAIDPANREWATQLGLAHNNLGKMALLHGDLAMAVDQYRKDVAIERALAAADTGDNAQAERLVLARAALGRTLALVGDTDAGIAELRLAMEGSERLVAQEPASTAFQEDRGLYATQLAQLLRLKGDAAAARTLSRTGVEVFSRLVATNATNPGWARGLADAWLERAMQSRDAGQRSRAAAESRRALAILEPLLLQQPEDRATVLSTAGGYMLLASVTEDPTAARVLREGSLRVVGAASSGRDDPRLAALQVETLLALDRGPDARALLPGLWRTGYRDPGLSQVLRDHGIDPAPGAARLAAGRADAGPRGPRPDPESPETGLPVAGEAKP